MLEETASIKTVGQNEHVIIRDLEKNSIWLEYKNEGMKDEAKEVGEGQIMSKL